MEWLINIIKEWINIRGNLPPIFVDRGDPAVHDFTLPDFTADGAWHELDLSAIVPEHAKGVSLFGIGKNVIIVKEFLVRKHGNANEKAVSGITTTMAGVANYFDATIAIDTDRKIDYKLTATGWIVVVLTVKNWWY